MFSMSVGTLWVIGGALKFTLLGLNIAIPGFLVWVALACSIVATCITQLIGQYLSKLKQQ